jgi:LacI family transcriptional regulator
MLPKKAGTRRATVQDVAQAAGVSASTVSRALNGSGYAAEAVRQRVFAAAARIGYVPDANARNLRQGTSRAIGVLVSDLRNPFYANLAVGIEKAVREAGLQMLLTNDSADIDDELEAARTLVAMRVPGVIMTPVSNKAVTLLRDNGIAVVQVDRRVGRGDVVLGGNEPAAYQLTSHLIELGHQRIALIIDETRWVTGAGRLAGYQRAHRENGLPLDESLVAFTSFDAAAAAETTSQLLDVRPDVTAVFAANNVLAQGAFEAIGRSGRRMPDDISLAGYDDVPWMSMVQPRLTTVSQHTEEMGRRAAELLLSRLGTPKAGRSRTIEVDSSLVVRDSTSAPRKQ